MNIFQVDDLNFLRDIVIDTLKIKGIRYRLPKKTKEEKEVFYGDYQVFQKPIHFLPKCAVQRLNGSLIDVPLFLYDICSIIETNLEIEGLFRKAGSTCKQRENKIQINSGKKVTKDVNIIDACNLVKLFFRELPQPILPYEVHEAFLKCLLLPNMERQVEALLLSCLLLPLDHVSTLAYFLEFLLKVSKLSHKNKMDVKNLAIVLTPSLMPVVQQPKSSNNLKITHHIRVMEVLIENAEEVGLLPIQIQERVALSMLPQSKRKKRSGSLTRMFSGLKKIVGTRGSTTPEWDSARRQSQSPCLSSERKRKAREDVDSPSSGKKKKQGFAESTTPLRCRMNSYGVPVIATCNPMPVNLKRIRSRSPSQSQRRLFPTLSSASFREPAEEIKSRVNLTRGSTLRKQKSSSILSLRPSTDDTHRKRLERRLSIISSWGKKKASQTGLFLNKSAPDYDGEVIEMQEMVEVAATEEAKPIQDSETITISKSEYEEIKNRVSALENCISHELESIKSAHSVQDVYEKTLEESERITADHLAGKLTRELKIRRSLENKMIRSPSARKIGSIRRRSRELIQKNMELSRSESINCNSKSSLKRGRPNTLQTGLPSPSSLRTLSSSDLTDKSAPSLRDAVTRTSSFQETNLGMQWHNGPDFFSHKVLAQRLLPSTQGRPSITELRHHNAGMVLEKTKLFNSLNQSGDSVEDQSKKMQRRQSVRIENIRKNQDNQKSPHKIGALRTKSMRNVATPKKKMKFPETKENVDKHTKQASSYRRHAKDGESGAKVTPPLREANSMHKTPRQMPPIKKSLGTRSPRQICKTPISELRSLTRPRATPVRAGHDICATPSRRTPRRSPRILARPALSHQSR